jgi:hypothetical protein
MKSELRIPLCSLCSLLTIPALGYASIPFWKWYVIHQIASTPNEMYSPDPGQFGVFAVIAGAVGTGLFGAVVGLSLVWISKRRNEPLPWLRAASVIMNGLGLCIGAFLLFKHIVGSSV